MKNGAATKFLFVLLAAIGLWAGFVHCESLTFPEGVTLVDIEPAPGGEDEGYPTVAAAVHGGWFWLGRDGGLRRYDRESLEWKFFKYDPSRCKGTGTINVAPDGRFIWGRITNTGALCRLDPDTGTWKTLDHWTVQLHTGPGYPFIPEKDNYLVASSGGPDYEGVSIISRETEEWVKLLKTKSASAMLLDKSYIWLGVPQGILRINRITEDYHYIQPYEHGGGALVKDIVAIPGGMAFATIGERTGILGDKIEITENSIRVYMRRNDKWYTYAKDDRDKIVDDIQSGKIVVSNIKTTPGVLVYKGDDWKLLTGEDGLPSDTVLDLEADSKYLYLSSYKGFRVLEINTLQPVVLNTRIVNSIRQVRRIIADEQYLWVMTNRGLFRVEKKVLFSAPR